MTTPNQPIESHEVHSRRLILHAEDELDRGDRLQASEKAWGAVAHYLKIIADRRGWQYTGHSDAHIIAGNLAREEGNPEITQLYNVANRLHTNFYIDRKTTDVLRSDIEEVKTLLEMLRAVEERWDNSSH